MKKSVSSNISLERNHSTSFSEFLDSEYLKGEVIAVRNEEGGFYLAECVENITAEDIERSESFKVS